MRDYVYPSIFFAYFFFFLALCSALFFFIRSIKDGYWGRNAEEPKYRMLAEEESPEVRQAASLAQAAGSAQPNVPDQRPSTPDIF